MVTMDQIVKKILKIISEKTDVGYEHQSISADTELLTSGLGLDSVVMLRLIAAIEDEVGIEFDDTDLPIEVFKNVGTLAEAVRKKLQAGSS